MSLFRPNGPRTGASPFRFLQLDPLPRVMLFTAGILISLLVCWFCGQDPNLSQPASRSLFILVLAAWLWFTDAAPPFSVGILIIGLNIALLGRPGGVFATSSDDWQDFVNVLGHPLVWLFFGGFVLAAGLSRSGIDRRLALWILSGNKVTSRRTLALMMLATFVFSMLMSNTATTAMMLVLLQPIIGSRDRSDRLSRGLILGIVVAANLGGMGSIIGTPPNAIAVASLGNATEPIAISFFGWMLLGFPVGSVLLIGSYFWLVFRYLRSEQTAELSIGDSADPAGHGLKRWQRVLTAATAATTVGLWMTSSFHGLPTPVISFVPIVIFTVSGVLNEAEVRTLPYDVLFLLAGGIALGQSMQVTGLSDWLVSRLPWEDYSPWMIALAVTVATLIMSNFMSNTAAANVMLPLATSLAGEHALTVVAPAALAASAAMCLPVSTPPGALAFSTQRLRTVDLLEVGVAIGLLAPLLSIPWVRFVASIYWPR